MASLDDVACGAIDRRRAPCPTRSAAVGEPHLILHRSTCAADRDIALGQHRMRVMRAQFRVPGELARKGIRLDDHVGDLSRQAGQVERGPIDDFDPHDIVDRDARHLGEDVVGLARQPLAVDQHVAARLPQPAQLLALADRKARYLAQHVERVLGCEAREVGDGVDLAILDRSGTGRCGNFARSGWRCAAGLRRVLCKGGRGERERDGQADPRDGDAAPAAPRAAQARGRPPSVEEHPRHPSPSPQPICGPPPADRPARSAATPRSASRRRGAASPSPCDSRPVWRKRCWAHRSAGCGRRAGTGWTGPAP